MRRCLLDAMHFRVFQPVSHIIVRFGPVHALFAIGLPPLTESLSRYASLDRSIGWP